MKLLLIPILFITLTVNAQWKSYHLTTKGDTINCIDNKDMKQGRWSTKVEGLRGEPGYADEGIYKDGKKEGVWRVYTSMGDLLSIENYRWGNKDGKSLYYNMTGLIREESWKAVNPLNPFDTVDVYDPIDPTKVERKVVRIEGSAVKHGTWKYYDDGPGGTVRSENYFLDKLQLPKDLAAETPLMDSSTVKVKKAALTKPKEVLDFEKKTGKKKVKVIDGSTY